ncbi:MBL fold metallo-hydrolase [Kiloniella majae]|uniref:MBL fold metallo-hydrolase n=1 Tax=Kiloniella majae TaxID=1938558 RepID=UPI000A2794D4|nr:MBL fold metallo-hydrolase [Kiloniella majae]
MTQRQKDETIIHRPQIVAVDDDWFDVQKVSNRLYTISEPRHYEHTVMNLLVGKQHAVLIDTGCGIGNLSRVVEQLTNLPVTVVNTHTHLDHLGSNHQFSDIIMFDHPNSRNVSQNGALKEDFVRELLDEKFVTPPWPRSFELASTTLPPFKVSRWIKHEDILELGDICLKVLHTPGEASDHICLLEQNDRILFTGDILLHGAVWSHLDGGDIEELSHSYELLMQYYDEIDFLMPSHNTSCLEKNLLPIALAGVKEILDGNVVPRQGKDAWGRFYNEYDFGRISILTRQLSR